MQKALSEASSSRGKEKGIESRDTAGKLTSARRQAMIDTTIKPKINPGQAGDHDDKGGMTGAQSPRETPEEPAEVVRYLRKTNRTAYPGKPAAAS
jgi:hypothetical protein